MKISSMKKGSTGVSTLEPQKAFTKVAQTAATVPPLPEGVLYAFSVDPGLDGAWALLDARTGDVVERGEFMDKESMRRLIIQHRKDAVFTGEDPTSATGQQGHANPISKFRFGSNYGSYVGMVYGITGAMPVMLAPIFWKKRAGLAGTEKDAVVQAVRASLGHGFDLRRTPRCKTDWVDLADAIMCGLVYLEMATGRTLTSPVDWTKP